MTRAQAWALAILWGDKAVLDRTPVIKEYDIWSDIVE